VPSTTTKNFTNIDIGICSKVQIFLSVVVALTAAAATTTTFSLGVIMAVHKLTFFSFIFIVVFFFFLLFFGCSALPPNTTLTDYSALLETKLSIFVEKHNMTAHTFYDQLHEAQTSDPMAGQIIQYLLGATEYRRVVDLLIDRKMFHFGMGGPIGAAVGTDGSVRQATSEGKQSGGESGRDSSSKESSESDMSSSSQSFGRKSSEDNMLADAGGKEFESVDEESSSSSTRKK
jgi:hypothetical protein